MPTTHEGSLRAEGKRFAVIAARFNDFMVEKLVEGATDALRRSGAADTDVEIFRCPGAFEIPGLLRRVVDTGRFHGVICLGVVIRGATPHFDLVVGEATSGVARIAAEAQVAIGFGVLACDSIEQAVERAGSKAGNRGFDSAMVAIEMANVYDDIAKSAEGGRGLISKRSVASRAETGHRLGAGKRSPSPGTAALARRRRKGR